jgi:hypothetical protein
MKTSANFDVESSSISYSLLNSLNSKRVSSQKNKFLFFKFSSFEYSIINFNEVKHQTYFNSNKKFKLLFCGLFSDRPNVIAAAVSLLAVLQIFHLHLLFLK